jgi:hypothetical protein
MSRETGQHGRVSTFRDGDLKICELCGHLNLSANTECFVCGWHGHFEQSQEVVRSAVELAVRRYGRLEIQYLTDPRTYREPEPPKPAARFVAFMRRCWSWLSS